jgi:hypothetical protein
MMCSWKLFGLKKEVFYYYVNYCYGIDHECMWDLKAGAFDAFLYMLATKKPINLTFFFKTFGIINLN